MPTPPKPQVPELASELIFRPHPASDPGPDISRIVSHFELKQQVAFAQTVLASQVAVAKAHAEGLQNIHDAMGRLQS